MPKPAARHMEQPTAEQTEVERWDAERTLQENIPQILDKGCAYPDHCGAENERRLPAHAPESPAVTSLLNTARYLTLPDVLSSKPA